MAWLLQHAPELAAAGTLLLGFWHYVVRGTVKFLIRAVRLAPILSSADKALARIEAEISEVKAEVKTNHGGSLKDAVRRIEIKVTTLDKKTDDQTKDLTQQIRSVKATALQSHRAADRAGKVATQALELVAGRQPPAE